MDFLAGTADGKADAPRPAASVGVGTVADSVDALSPGRPVSEELTAVLIVARVEELVEEMIVEDKVLEINLPFGDKRTPVPLLQQSGELSQQ